jgi:hypothetical protein
MTAICAEEEAKTPAGNGAARLRAANRFPSAACDVSTAQARNISSSAALLLSGFEHLTASKDDYSSRQSNRRSKMSQNDLTISEVLKDPLIRLMMRADRVTLKKMRILLADAAIKQGS